jgi:hypothetical protein
MGWPLIAAQLGIQVGLWAINKYLLDDRQKLPKPKPEGLEFAQTKIGSPIPYLAGTVRVDNSVLAWHGNHSAKPYGVNQFTYGLDMVLELGVPMWDEAAAPWSSWRATRPPKVRRVWWGDKEILLKDSGLQKVLTHASENFVTLQLGSDGMLNVRMSFFDGRSDQTLTGLMRDALLLAGTADELIPGYRHKMLLGIYAGGVAGSTIGFNPRVPAISAEVQALGPEAISVDANPAWVLYDLLCRPVFGLGFDPDDVDIASFEAAADTLTGEGHGCSIVIQTTEEAPRVFASVLAQIDADIFIDPATGLLRLRLIRADYDPGTIPVLDADNVIGWPTIETVSDRSLVNAVNVHFTDRSRGYKDDIAAAQSDDTGALRPNQRNVLDFQAPGCTTAALARVIAARELSVGSQPLTSIRARVNREFYDVVIGDAIKVNLPDDQIENQVFRVMHADLGQLADGAIELVLIRDVFDQVAGAYPVPEAETEPTLLPLRTRLATEAPWWLQYRGFVDGVLASLADQRLLAAAVAEPDAPLANNARHDSESGGLTGDLSTTTPAADVPQQFFRATATVATAYPATAAPYDTTTGIVIENTGGVLPNSALLWDELGATEAQIASYGTCLALLGEELIAFRSVTNLGAGQYRLNNVWRGLLDTVPADHAIGARLYLLDTDAIGRRAWPDDFHARVSAIPSYKIYAGSDGVDGSDDLEIAGRASRELPAADLRIRGYDLDGTARSPAATQTYPLLGDFVAASRLEAAVDVAARARTLEHPYVVRGDDATSYPAAAGTTWALYGQKHGEDEVAITGYGALATPNATAALLGEVGHGDIDIILHTVGPDGRRGWQSPRARVIAPTWRDLLANGSADYAALLPGWTADMGTWAVQTGTSSLSRTATGRWLQPSVGADGVARIEQVVAVSGFTPTGLVALATLYARGFDGDATDTATITIIALDANGGTLATGSAAAFAAPTTHWRRGEHELTLPAGTASVAVRVTLDSDDEATPDVGVTRVQLQVGQMSDELLTDPSFDGGLGSWTNVSNSFVLNTANVHSSRNGTLNAAQGGAFASSEIRQDVAIPTGYAYGVALLTLARSTTIAGDTGTVTLEVLDGGGAVLASATTGAEHSFPGGVDTWERRRLAVQLPDGAVTLRTRLIATRAAGAGNSGACFDDLSLRVHKDLDPVFEHDFDFSAPLWRVAPVNWQRAWLDWPTLSAAPIMVWDGASVTPSVQPSEQLDGPAFAWSDASTPDPAAFVGYWDVGPDADDVDGDLEHVTSIDAYQLTRAIAASAVDLQVSGDDDVSGEEYGAFAVDEDFSVAILFRTDEPTFGGACGLVGRRGNTGLGWGLRLDATGQLQCVMQGASGTATATGGTSLADRAPHWAFLVHDAAATTLRLYDDRGSVVTASTAAIGSIAAAGAPLRIGRDGPASATGGLQIARVLIWRAKLEVADIAAIAPVILDSGDPTGFAGGFTSNRVVWLPGPDGADGARLVRYPVNTSHVAYWASGYGLALTAGNTNKIPSHDFTDGDFWNAETANVALTHDLVDPTGLPRGVRVTTTSADEGITCRPVTMGVGTPLSVVLWARTADGVARTLKVQLIDDVPATIDTETVALTGLWQRFTVSLGPWANSTPEATLRFALDSTGSFDLAHVLWAGFGSDIPLAVQDAGVTISDTERDHVDTIPAQANHEGELYVEGVALMATPTAGATIVSVDDGSTDLGKRAIEIAAAAVPRFAHHDDTPTQTNTDGAAIDWSAAWTLRARWNRLELPESLGEQVGLVVDGSADSETYAALAYSVGASSLAAIRIGGGGPGPTTSPNAVIRRVVVRVREPKLP